MKKSEKLYRAIGGIDEKKIAEADGYYPDEQRGSGLRAAFEIAAVVLVVLGSVVLSLFLTKVSGEQNIAASSGAPEKTAALTESVKDAPAVTGKYLDLQRVCDIVNESKSFDEISEKLKLERPTPDKYREWSSFKQYDYRVNGETGYEEYVQVTSRYNAVFYYKVDSDGNTVYSSIWSDEAGGAAAPLLTAETLRKNTYSLEEYSNIRDNFTPVYYDQALIDEFINKIYSHPKTTGMSLKLRDEEPQDASGYTVTEGFGCTLYTDNGYTEAFCGLESPCVEYEFTGYPDCIDGPYKVTRIDIYNCETKICGIGADSSFEEFEAVFSKLGFEVKRTSFGVSSAIVASVEGFSVSLYAPVGDAVPHLSLCLAVTNNHRVVF